MKKKTVPGMLFYDRLDGQIVLQLSYDEIEETMSFVCVEDGRTEFVQGKTFSRDAADDFEKMLLTYELIGEP